MKKPRVLDERAISFKISEGLLEVYDQKDYLIGDRPLPIPVEQGMSVDEIYNIATQCNYDLDEMIGSILQEAVMENREYDIWLSYEEIIFFSPSTQKWVLEPYDGIFAWLESILVEEETEEVETSVKEEETEPVDTTEEVLEEVSEEETEDKEETDTVEEVEASTEKVAEVIEKDEKTEKLEVWKSAYDAVINSNEEVSGVTMKHLMDTATIIIIEEKKDIFEIDERDILFKLVTQEKVIFNGIDVLRAALYNAHLLFAENTVAHEFSTEAEVEASDDGYG